jgi:hypothetical protein
MLSCCDGDHVVDDGSVPPGMSLGSVQQGHLRAVGVLTMAQPGFTGLAEV